jgi:hypothetical protein
LVKQIRTSRSKSTAGRRRVVPGYSRHERTPRQHVIELNAEGTDDRSLGALADQDHEAVRGRLRPIFAAARAKLSQREVAAKLAAGAKEPKGAVWRWLDQAATRELLLREGEGTKASPYRYWLPGQEEEWKDEPLHALHESILQASAAALETGHAKGGGPSSTAAPARAGC